MIFNVIEGIDFAGKTTLFNLLRSNLEGVEFNGKYVTTDHSNPNDIFFIQNPASLPMGREIKQLILDNNVTPITRFLLYQGAFNELLVQARLLPNMTIWERSPVSGFAYSPFTFHELKSFFKLSIFKSLYINRLIILMIKKETLEFRMSLQPESLDYIESAGVDALLKIQDKIIGTANEFYDWGLINEIRILNSEETPETLLKQARDVFLSR